MSKKAKHKSDSKKPPSLELGKRSRRKSAASFRAGKKGVVSRGRLFALAGAAVLVIVAFTLLLAFRDVPRMVQHGYAERMRAYLGIAASVALLGAVGLTVAGVRAAKHIDVLAERLTAEWRYLQSQGLSSLRQTSALDLAVLLFIMIVGSWLRARYLGQPMRYDEAYTYNFYGRFPLTVSLSAYDSPNNHLLNTALVHLSTVLWGNYEWAIRLPAFLFGVATVPSVYLLSRKFAGAGSALVAASASAVWPVLVEYSGDARGYSAVAFFFVVAVAAAHKLLERDILLLRIALVCASVGMLYTTPAGIYAFATCWVWLGVGVLVQHRYRQMGELRRRRRRATDHARKSDQRESLGVDLWTVVGLGLVCGVILLMLYGFPFVVGGLAGVLQRSDIRPLGLRAYLAAAPGNLVDIAELVFRSIPLPVAVVTVIFWSIGSTTALAGRDLWRKAIAELPEAGLLAALFLTLVQRQWPYTRAWIFVVPLLLVGTARGLEAAFSTLSRVVGSPIRRLKAIALPLLAVGVAAWSAAALASSGSISRSEDTGYSPDARNATLYLSGKLEEGDSVIVRVPSDAPLMYYFAREGLGLEYFKPHQPKRVFVYVDTQRERVEGVLGAFGVRLPEGEVPKQIWEGERATVFEVDNFLTS